MADVPDLVPVTLDSLVMDDTADADGVRWRVLREGLVGWAAPVVDVQTSPLTGRHGVSRPTGRYRARDLAVRGRVLSPTFETAWAAYYRLVSLTQLGTTLTLVVGEPIPKQLTVELSDVPDLSEPLGGDDYGWRFNYQLPLGAEYPFKRALEAVTVHVGAGSTVTHTAAGTFPAELEVSVTSGGTVDLAIGTQRLRTSSLPAGAVLTSGPGFPNPKRTIRSSAGANLFAATLTPMQWPAMASGDNTLHQSGSAGLDVRYFPTYT